MQFKHSVTHYAIIASKLGLLQIESNSRWGEHYLQALKSESYSTSSGFSTTNFVVHVQNREENRKHLTSYNVSVTW